MAPAGPPFAPAGRMRLPSGPPHLPGRALHDPARHQVDEDREHEQEQAESDQRGAERAAGGLAELQRDDRGYRVTAVEEVTGDLGGVADDQRYRDRLAHRPAKPDQDRA